MSIGTVISLQIVSFHTVVNQWYCQMPTPTQSPAVDWMKFPPSLVVNSIKLCYFYCLKPIYLISLYKSIYFFDKYFSQQVSM